MAALRQHIQNPGRKAKQLNPNPLPAWATPGGVQGQIVNVQPLPPAINQPNQQQPGPNQQQQQPNIANQPTLKMQWRKPNKQNQQISPNQQKLNAVQQQAQQQAQQRAANNRQLNQDINVLNATENLVGKAQGIVGDTQLRLEALPQPGSIALPLLVLIVLYLLIQPVNGAPRFVWLWLVIIGQADLPGAGTVSANGSVASFDATPVPNAGGKSGAGPNGPLSMPVYSPGLEDF